jgi:hypothetical protein
MRPLGHESEIAFRIDAVELRSVEQRVDDCSALPAGIRTSKE